MESHLKTGTAAPWQGKNVASSTALTSPIKKGSNFKNRTRLTFRSSFWLPACFTYGTLYLK
ncbi:hypothetical protein APS_0548 [Acetobacter pasteurianus subsp. pasteurianus LMG 1262 = NBRC 106471]|nr:hypothetical protein APS_0548 [Acetobacter pasteurianus subsp. pasteurianus LMG 1262 = NBRC 106471]